MNGNWASALTLFAKNPSPQSTLPQGVYLRHDDHTLTIFDGYPKAKYHFLVLPRIPFKLASASPSIAAPKLGLAGGKLSLGASSSSSQVPSSHLNSLNDLLASPYAAQVLDKLKTASHQVIGLIKEEMRASRLKGVEGSCGVEWGVRVGFHAVPSMETVHLHVISDELVSDRLKNKKHYQSFRPGHGFWLDLQYIEDLLKQGRNSLPHSKAHYESLLKSPLVSFRNGRQFSHLPSLKEHLEEEWRLEVKSKMSKVTQTKHSRSEGDEEQAKPRKAVKKAGSASSSDTESES